MAAMYAVYHGPAGLKRIALKVHGFTQVLKEAVEKLGFKAINSEFFDTLTFDVSKAVQNSSIVHAAASSAAINLRRIDDKHVGVTLDEGVSSDDLTALINIFASAAASSPVSLSKFVPVNDISPCIYKIPLGN
jgi:glycine dehydrogenase